MYNAINIIPDSDGKKKVKMDFRQLEESIKNNPPEPTQMAEISNFAVDFGTNLQDFATKFNNIDKMSDDELYELVSSTFHIVVRYCYDNQNNASIQFIWNLFTNSRYILALTSVLSNIQQLDYQTTLALNRIMYNIYTMPDDNVGKMVKDGLNGLSQIVNANVVRALSGTRLPEGSKTAADIGMCAYSSEILQIGVKRVNLYMINTCDDKAFDEQTIVNVYQELYCSCLTKLFEGIMFDCYTKEDMSNMIESQINIYYTINEAVLDILNQAPTNVIYQVLRAYAIDYANMATPYYRFKMALSEDYARINSVIAALEQEKIYVP